MGIAISLHNLRVCSDYLKIQQKEKDALSTKK